MIRIVARPLLRPSTGPSRRAEPARVTTVACALLLTLVALPALGQADRAAAAAWLLSEQNPDGSFGELPIRDTAGVLGAFGSGAGSAEAALLSSELVLLLDRQDDTDDLARAVRALARRGSTSTAGLVEALLARRRPDGGYGFAPGHASSPLETALALQALAAAGVTSAQSAGPSLLWLLAHQNPDGSFALEENGPSVWVTALCLDALGRYAGIFNLAEGIADARSWLLAGQHPDGSFGHAETRLRDTALVERALLVSGGSGPSANAYLVGSQAADGSFGSDVLTTALVLEILDASAPNVRAVAGGIQIVPEDPAVGTSVLVRAFFENTSAVALSGVRVRLLADGAPLGADEVVSLAPAERRSFDRTWSANALGDRVLSVAVDPLAALAETNEADNGLTRTVRVVLPAPGNVSAVIDDGLVELAFQSLAPLGAVAYRVYRDGALRAEVAVPAYTDSGLTNGQAYAYQLSAVDAAGIEGKRSPLYLITPAEPPAGADLALQGIDVVLGAGSHVSFGVRNGGTTDVTNVGVIGLLRRVGASAADTFFARTVPVVGGQGTVAIDEPFTTPSDPGQYVMSLIVDPEDAITELSEGNNRVDINLTITPPPEPPEVPGDPPPPPPPPPPAPGDPPVTGPDPGTPPPAAVPPDVWVRTIDFATEPAVLFEGTPFTLVGALSNRGGGPGQDIVVRLFDGDPEDGVLLSEVLVPSLETSAVPLAFENLVLGGGIHELHIVGDATDRYAEGNEFNNHDSIVIEVDGLTPVLQLDSLLLVSPAAAEKGTELTITSTVVNRSNRDLEQVMLTVDLVFEETGATVHTATAPAGDLAKRGVAVVDVATFTPADNGNYLITLSATGVNPLDGGAAEALTILGGTRSFQVGPFVEGSVVVTPSEVAVGDPEVSARVSFSARLATIADEDPLVTAVVEAADDGSSWSSSRVMAWSGGTCYGCHVQSQGLVAAVLADEVGIDPSITLLDEQWDRLIGWVTPTGSVQGNSDHESVGLATWAVSTYPDVGDPTNCAPGLYCGESSTCVSACTVDADCQDGERCNHDGRCLEAQPVCVIDAQCPTGQFCDGQGTCAFACVDDGDCHGAGEVCSESGRCEVPERCVVDTDCAAGSHCGGTGVCGLTCTGDTDCGAGETCSAAGRCLGATPSCTTDANCAAGTFCDGQGICQATCADDDECFLGETCSPAGRCVVDRCDKGLPSNVDLFQALADRELTFQQADGRWNGIRNSWTTAHTMTSYMMQAYTRAYTVSGEPRYADAVARGTNWLVSRNLSSLSDFDAGRVLHAFNTLLPFYDALEDEARVAEVRELQESYASHLIGRQALDGSWDDDGTSGNQGPVITTAIVLFGLVSSGLFDRDNVTIRDGILYLLNAQLLDGSWGTLNGGNVNIDDTTMVMLAMPKLVELLTSLDFELEVELPDTITFKSADRDVTSTDLDHGSLHHFDFPGLRDGYTTHVDVDLVMKGMEHEEERPIASRIGLFYVNRANGDRVELPLDIPTVRATTSVAVDIDVPALTYTQQDAVPISLDVTGLAPGLLDPVTLVDIVDADGAFVERVATVRHNEADITAVSSFGWYVPLTVIAGGVELEDVVFDVDVDFTAALTDAGEAGSVIASSVRVFENAITTAGAGLVEVPATFTQHATWDAEGAASGRLVLAMPGVTAVGGERHFLVLFNTADRGVPPPPTLVPLAGQGLQVRWRALDVAQSNLNPASPDELVYQPAPQVRRRLSLVDTDLGTASPAGGLPADRFGAEIEGFVYAPALGSYLFELESDDGSWLYIDDHLVVDNAAKGLTRREGVRTLDAGFHRIRIAYFDDTGAASLRLRWRPPGQPALSAMPVAALYEPARSTQGFDDAAVALVEGGGLVWNSGNAPPGAYSARATFSALGAPVTIDEDAFELLPLPVPVGATALVGSVAPDQALYSIHDYVRLDARVENPDAVFAYGALDAVIEVVSPSGTVLASYPRALAGIGAGAFAPWSETWSTGASAPGVYAVRLVVTDAAEGEERATAEASFTITAPPVEGVLAGTIEAAPREITAGTPVTLSHDVGNVGFADLAAVDVRVEVRRVADGELMATFESAITTLGAGTVVEGSSVFDSAGLVPDAYAGVLVAEEIPLDFSIFEIIGVTPPDAGPAVDAGGSDLALVLPPEPADLCTGAALTVSASGGQPPYRYEVVDTALADVDTAAGAGGGEAVGILVPKAAGHLTVAVVDDAGDRAEAELIIPPPLAPMTTVLSVGESVVFGDVTARPLPRAVEGYRWSSSEEAVATISEQGLLVGVAPGETTISLLPEGAGEPLTSGPVRVLPTGSLVVDVVTEAGEPVPSAIVEVAGRRVSADDEGRATFAALPTGWHPVSVRSPSWLVVNASPLEVTASREKVGAVVVAPAAGAFSGAVTDVAGAPIARAHVTLVESETGRYHRTRADEAGTFAIAMSTADLDAAWFAHVAADGYLTSFDLSHTYRRADRVDVALTALPPGVVDDLSPAGGGFSAWVAPPGCERDRSRIRLAPQRVTPPEGAAPEERIAVVTARRIETVPRIRSGTYGFALPAGFELRPGSAVEVRLALLASEMAESAQALEVQWAPTLEGPWQTEPASSIRIEEETVVFLSDRLGAFRALLRDDPPPPPPDGGVPDEESYARGGGCLCGAQAASASDALLLAAFGACLVLFRGRSLRSRGRRR